MAPAILTNPEVTMATLEYVLPMASLTKLTTKWASSAPMEPTLKSPRVFALVSPQKLPSHDFDSALALLWKERPHGVSVDQLPSAFNDVVLEPRITEATFPFQAAYVAEFGTAAASVGLF